MQRSTSIMGTRLLFWDDLVAGEQLQSLLDFFGVRLRGRRYGQPREHVRHDVPRGDRELLARHLRIQTPQNPLGGQVLRAEYGWAECRICGAALGSRDLFGHGFVWPEGAEHYVLEHDVWTKECSEMIAVVQRRIARFTP